MHYKRKESLKLILYACLINGHFEMYNYILNHLHNCIVSWVKLKSTQLVLGLEWYNNKF